MFRISCKQHTYTQGEKFEFHLKLQRVVHVVTNASEALIKANVCVHKADTRNTTLGMTAGCRNDRTHSLLLGMERSGGHFQLYIFDF